MQKLSIAAFSAAARSVLLGVALAAAATAPAAATEPKQGSGPVDLSSPAPEDARLYFISPRDGDVVAPTFTVKFGLEGMGVAPAGVDHPHTGHHHLLIDVTEDPELGQPLPATEQVRHFGGGQTETEVTLPPGQHRLRLVLGNHLHVPHDPPVMSETITVTVSESASD